MTTQELHRQAFVSRYQAAFGNFPAAKSADEARIWWRLVDEVPDEKVESLFRVVADAWGERMGGPRLMAFERAWRELVAKVPRAPQSDNAPICAYCSNTGRTWYLAWRDGEIGTWRVSLETTHGLLSRVSVPCACDFGAPMRHEVSSDLRQRVRRWWLDTLMPEADRRGIGANVLAHELIRESGGGPVPMLDWRWDYNRPRGGFKHKATGAVWEPAEKEKTTMPLKATAQSRSEPTPAASVEPVGEIAFGEDVHYEPPSVSDTPVDVGDDMPF